MLTTALNKSPKPPIIVDDILVTELNLGTTPPELEILEIGDLAEDRFRGIFKMTYAGDAFLTLKTRVQANPLNTYLSTKPCFASPQPLAASSGLTIPLQITLSDIKLSGFVILVFSRQKGITLVFRNDPLESLKVSSTCDSIPFVREYLQKEIEAQLRVLFMEDLPAIIHRLSLRLLVTEHATPTADAEGITRNMSDDSDRPINPLATPSQKAQDAFGRPLEDDTFSLASEDVPENYASFSQKNLLRLAALTDSHRTLSLFTSPIRDAVFRARAGAAEKAESSESATPGSRIALSRRHSVASSVGSAASSHSWSETLSTCSSIRQPLSTTSSTYSSIGSKSKLHSGQRRRKNRIVDLRHPSTVVEVPETSARAVSPEISSMTEFTENEPNKGVSSHTSPSATKPQEVPLHAPRPLPVRHFHRSISAATYQPTITGAQEPLAHVSHKTVKSCMPAHSPSRAYSAEQSLSPGADGLRPSAPFNTGTSGGILEQAWMLKMANEISRKVRDEKAAGAGAVAAAAVKLERDGLKMELGLNYDGLGLPPPAYAA